MKILKWAAAIAAVVASLAAIVWFADLKSNGTAEARNGPGKMAAPEVRNAATQGTLETLLSQKTGLSLDTINKLELAALGVAADKGKAMGLASGQVANLQPATVSPLINSIFDGVAQAAGVSDADLFNGLAGGQSLAQIAAPHGKDAAALKTSLTALLQSETSAAEKAGLLSPAQSAPLAAMVKSQLDKIITASHAPEQKTP